MEKAEKIGLGFATAGHVLLLGLLSVSFIVPNPLKLNSPPIEVDLVDEVALQSTAPVISTAPPPPSTAPEVGPQERADAAPEAEPAPTPEPARPAPPPPKPAPATRPTERAKPKPPAPQAAKPADRPARTPARAQPAAPDRSASRPAPAAAKPATPAAKPTGTRNRSLALSSDIEAGARSERSARTSTSTPAATLGPQQKSALDAEIRRQLRPHWKPPSGADADKLVTLLSVRLDRNGNVQGRPEVVEQMGINASNRPQASLHAERAIQAVMRASPFDNLPPQFYDQWKWLKPLRFDARLLR